MNRRTAAITTTQTRRTAQFDKDDSAQESAGNRGPSAGSLWDELDLCSKRVESPAFFSNFFYALAEKKRESGSQLFSARSSALRVV